MYPTNQRNVNVNSFCGDVVLDGFNMAYKDEDSILKHKDEKQIY